MVYSGGGEIMPKCTKCGGEINLEDVVDETEGTTEFYKECVGYCSSCGTDFQWVDVYDFNFKEVRKLKES